MPWISDSLAISRNLGCYSRTEIIPCGWREVLLMKVAFYPT